MQSGMLAISSFQAFLVCRILTFLASSKLVAARTVWRLMADPNSKFPKPRRARGRTLLVRDEVLAYFNLPGGEAN